MKHRCVCLYVCLCVCVCVSIHTEPVEQTRITHTMEYDVAFCRSGRILPNLSVSGLFFFFFLAGWSLITNDSILEIEIGQVGAETVSTYILLWNTEWHACNFGCDGYWKVSAQMG